MPDIVGVRFREVGKIRYFAMNNLRLKAGDYVIADTRRVKEFGKVLVVKNVKNIESILNDYEKLLKKATEADIKKNKHNFKKENEAKIICEKKIKEFSLKMKIIDVEYLFDGNKIIFYFVSDSRVDFRELVKSLASIFKVRIELHQVGVRDEAKIIGGLGICGKPLCCATFLNDFQPVSIKMAKDQGLSLNPTKISGTCGRLMCCLKYEEDTYLRIGENYPKTGDTVSTPSGEGVVMGSNILSGKVKVRLNNTAENIPITFDISEINKKDT